MLRQILIILFFATMISCSTEKKNNKELSRQIKSFSIFNYRSDSIRHFNSWTYLFNKDSLTILSTNKNYTWNICKIKLTSNQIDSINSYLFKIDFKRLIGNKSIDSSFKCGDLYCGAYYGFVDSMDRPEVYIPYRDGAYSKNSTQNLTNFLFNLKGQKSIDTVEIIQQALLIKTKYEKTAPPPPIMLKETIKFVPPIIKE